MIDEADRLLSQSYQNWLPQVLKAIQTVNEDHFSQGTDLNKTRTSDQYNVQSENEEKNEIEERERNKENDTKLSSLTTQRSEAFRFPTV